MQTSPKTYFRPAYVGVREWVGIELDQIREEELSVHLRDAWRLIAPKSRRANLGTR